MKILMVSYRFPPYNSIGAVRCGKMAKYLSELGHEVRILSCKDQPLPSTLALEVPKDHVYYTKWWNINAPVEKILGGRKKVLQGGLHTVGKKSGIKGKILQFLGGAYKTLLHLPDGQMGWRKFAVKKGLEIINQWQPDVIYASAWPISSLVVADKLSQKTGVPWVGELRDLWTDNPYYDTPKWKISLEKIWERRLFSRAKGLTTISDHAAETLESKYSCPVKVILNGFDAIDFDKNPQSLQKSPDFIVDGINILYAGMIYPGRRDPEPLLKALSLLPEGLKSKVKLHFYGSQLSVITQLAISLNIVPHVSVNNPISYKDILRLQQQSDLLLLLMWDSPQEKGTFTGKFFEYVGARRPILCIGGQDTPPAQLIKKRELGSVINDPSEIVVLLKEMIAMKEERGSIPPLPPEAGAGLTRKEQAEALSEFLTKIIAIKS